jgi:hypothetical protein
MPIDISPRVIEHVQHAREKAAKHNEYVIHLPRDKGGRGPPNSSLTRRRLKIMQGPVSPRSGRRKIFPQLETRAVRIRPEVVLACEPVDLDIAVRFDRRYQHFCSL